MVLSWSLTEVIRYEFYACTLLGAEPFPLLWLRYTTFYVLYPTGASSEAALIFSTLPPFSDLAAWGLTDVARGALFCIWWPCESAQVCGGCWRLMRARSALRPLHAHDEAAPPSAGLRRPRPHARRKTKIAVADTRATSHFHSDHSYNEQCILLSKPPCVSDCCYRRLLMLGASPILDPA